MIRVVVDTNVVVSGLLAPAGNEALVLLAIHQGLVHPCFSEEILAEYVEVIARPKFPFGAEAIAATLAMFRARGELIAPAGAPPVLPDADDAKFLHCAEAAHAEYLVTGNKRHFPPEASDIVQIVSAGELLDLITLAS
jgi:putative PIN family toxin of toxin-antitoxin system